MFLLIDWEGGCHSGDLWRQQQQEQRQDEEDDGDNSKDKSQNFELRDSKERSVQARVEGVFGVSVVCCITAGAKGSGSRAALGSEEGGTGKKLCRNHRWERSFNQCYPGTSPFGEELMSKVRT